MRDPRAKDSPELTDAYYHLVTRAVAGDFLFGDAEKEVLRKQVRIVAERCGIEVITHSVMDNHLHVVVYAPKRLQLSDDELVRRYALLHSGGSAWEARGLDEIRKMLGANQEDAVEWRSREMAKMGDISAYMKLLKQRYSIWYNKTHNRFGTLWAERFKSVQLQAGEAVIRLAAYVDVNAVRAAICRDPKDYRFCGYAEAVAGNRQAQAGLMRAFGTENWEDAQRAYRMRLFDRAARPSPRGMSLTADERDHVVTKGGELTLAEELLCRCRYFTDGAVFGSHAFVMERLRRFRLVTGRGQQMEPQPGSGAAEGFLVLHRLRDAPALAAT